MDHGWSLQFARATGTPMRLGNEVSCPRPMPRWSFLETSSSLSMLRTRWMSIFSPFKFTDNSPLDLHRSTLFDSSPWRTWWSSPGRFSRISPPPISGLFHPIPFSVSTPTRPSVPLNQRESVPFLLVRTWYSTPRSMVPSLWPSICKDASKPILVSSVRRVMSRFELLFFLKCLAITFLPNQSGDFGANVTWLGGLAPTFDRCSPLAGGCVLIIPREYDVVRYHNQSTINGVEVHIYGHFKISSWGTYSFLYPMTFYIYNGGTFEETTQGGFRFFLNTSIIVYPGGRFLTQPSNTHYSYRDRNVTLSSLKLNRATIFGPYQITIDSNGQFNHTGQSGARANLFIILSLSRLRHQHLEQYQSARCDAHLLLVSRLWRFENVSNDSSPGWSRLFLSGQWSKQDDFSSSRSSLLFE